MNKLSKVASLLSLMFLIILTGCPDPKGKEKSDEDIAKEKLSRSWKVSSVESDSGEDEADYQNGTITVALDGTYTIANFGSVKNPPAKKTSGNWKFTNTSFNEVILDEGTAEARTLTGVSVTESTLSFSFTGVGLKPADEITVTYNLVPAQ